MTVKKWHHDINKPIVYGIHEDKNCKKPRHYLDNYLKSKSIVPSPNSYTVAKDFSLKQNPMYIKSPRETDVDAIQKFQKKYKFPDQGTYSLNFKPVTNRLLGCFK